jgi:hypothetical protein
MNDFPALLWSRRSSKKEITAPCMSKGMLRFLPVFALLFTGLLGCAGIGPTRLRSDQLQYARAISEAQKRQILFNIVRIRYGDAPTFLLVNQVISSYTLEQAAELGLNLYPNAHGGNYATGLGGLTFTDHPTITFAPLSGEQLARAALRPLSPADLLPVAQGALPIDVLFRLAVQSIGPLENAVVLDGRERAGDPEFYELLADMRRLQVQGLLTVRFVSRKDGNHVFLGIADGGDPESRAAAARVRQLLGMTSGETEAEVVYGRLASSPDQIAVLTRSITAILAQVSAEIEVPPEDIAAGRTISAFPLSRLGLNPIVRVHYGRTAPPNNDAAVKYGEVWFWIDDDDFNSKVAYTVLGFLIALAQGTPAGQAPILTIPAR